MTKDAQFALRRGGTLVLFANKLHPQISIAASGCCQAPLLLHLMGALIMSGAGRACGPELPHCLQHLAGFPAMNGADCM